MLIIKRLFYRHKDCLSYTCNINISSQLRTNEPKEGKIMINKFKTGVTIACLTIISINANAALIGVLPATPGGTDYRAYYDNVADLTWLADANYAATQYVNSGGTTGDSTGQMSWEIANTWAAGLNINGITGWRLPNTVDVGNDGKTYSNIYQGVDYGYNITAQSELSNMFYNVLGNAADRDISGNYENQVLNPGPFINLQSRLTKVYWSATEYVPDPNTAWYFNISNGGQFSNFKSINYYAWAVKSGDVSAVPIPTAVWLFGRGLIML